MYFSARSIRRPSRFVFAVRPKRITGGDALCSWPLVGVAGLRLVCEESRHTLGMQESHKSQQTEGLLVSGTQPAL